MTITVGQRVRIEGLGLGTVLAVVKVGCCGGEQVSVVLDDNPRVVYVRPGDVLGV